nr:MAG TPA: hypothetical protein [Caudoviricetes sp.]
MDEQEIPKYKKSTESNISKSNRKAKHKHQYKECLIQYPISFAGKDRIQTHLCSYCIICGKIGDRVKDSIVKDYVRSEEYSRGIYYSVMSGTELYEEYHNKMPVFFVNDICKDKYVHIGKELNNE